MKPLKYITALIICLAFVFLAHSALEVTEKVSALSNENAALKTKIGALSLQIDNNHDTISAYQAQIDSMTQQITVMQQEQAVLKERTDYLDRGGDRGEKKIMHCTAYWEGSCGKSPDDPLYGITASGEYVREGFVAAGLELRIGTKVYIPSLGKTYTVMDRGGAIDNGDLDIYMPTRSACMAFGVQDLEAWIME
jgi:3D (Asp-Asp-Asp) domain-containing protein